jgi:predicted signal transduction protein with EAL and GGDEF domain
VEEWARALPTYDRVEAFRQQMDAFAATLPPAQQALLSDLIACALSARRTVPSPLAADLPALLAELSPVTFAPHPCP